MGRMRTRNVNATKVAQFCILRNCFKPFSWLISVLKIDSTCSLPPMYTAFSHRIFPCEVCFIPHLSPLSTRSPVHRILPQLHFMARVAWCKGAKPALQLTILCLLIGQPLAADPDGTIYPRLQNLNNRQQEALQREQQTYKNQLWTRVPARDNQRLHRDLKRQDTQQKQLQHQHRNKAISKQLRTFSPPDGSDRKHADRDLQRLRREQEAQRLQFKIQRRSWSIR